MPKLDQMPNCPTERPTPPQNNQQTYEIELITPMVGGGASVGTVDCDFSIRPTAIRGHLRYWWRLVRGHSLDPDTRRQREEEIFGSTDFPSPLTISVEHNQKTNPVEQFDPTNKQNLDSFGRITYPLFASIENKHLVTQKGLKFKLTLKNLGPEELSRQRKAQND